MSISSKANANTDVVVFAVDFADALSLYPDPNHPLVTTDILCVAVGCLHKSCQIVFEIMCNRWVAALLNVRES